MQRFSSVAEACTFINDQVVKYSQKLAEMWPSMSNRYIFTNNCADTADLFMNEGYEYDDYARQAFELLTQKGYVVPSEIGGYCVTPEGYANLGNWCVTSSNNAPSNPARDINPFVAWLMEPKDPD